MNERNSDPPFLFKGTYSPLGPRMTMKQKEFKISSPSYGPKLSQSEKVVSGVLLLHNWSSDLTHYLFQLRPVPFVKEGVTLLSSSQDNLSFLVFQRGTGMHTYSDPFEQELETHYSWKVGYRPCPVTKTSQTSD